MMEDAISETVGLEQLCMEDEVIAKCFAKGNDAKQLMECIDADNGVEGLNTVHVGSDMGCEGSGKRPSMDNGK